MTSNGYSQITDRKLLIGDDQLLKISNFGARSPKETIQRFALAIAHLRHEVESLKKTVDMQKKEIGELQVRTIER